VPKTRWEAKKAPSTASYTKSPKRSAQVVEKIASKSVAIHSLPKAVEFNETALSELPVPITTAWEGKRAVPSHARPRILA
jgi:hypothetical protein